jgi:hypothetical protein
VADAGYFLRKIQLYQGIQSFFKQRGHPANLNLPDDFANRLEIAITNKDQAVLAELLDMEVCAGTIVDSWGIIEVSTNPFRISAMAFEAGALDSIIQTLKVSYLDFYGTELHFLVPVTSKAFRYQYELTYISMRNSFAFFGFKRTPQVCPIESTPRTHQLTKLNATSRQGL